VKLVDADVLTWGDWVRWQRTERGSYVLPIPGDGGEPVHELRAVRGHRHGARQREELRVDGAHSDEHTRCLAAPPVGARLDRDDVAPGNDSEASTPADLRWDRLHRIRRGEIRTGTVTSIESFGVLVDIGDHTTGSINAAELSWQRYDHYTDVVQVGQEVTVQVLDVDLQRERVSLSRKAMQPDPLSQVTNAPGDLVPGRVTKLLPFGAFVLLGGTFTGAVEGLVHVSELSPAPDGHPADVLQVGDEVTVRILSVDRERRRVSLALGPAFREHQHPAEQDCGAGSRKSA